jgi:hypothetical protein
MVKNEYEDATDMIPDGHSVKVPMVIMDARPHFADLSDEVRKLRTETRSRYLQDLQSAWKSPAQRPKNSFSTERILPDADPMRSRTEARDQMIKRATEAWRMPHRDWSEPDLSTPPEEMLQRHLRTEPNADDQARRDAAYQSYKDRISNAWRTNPNAAGTIERQAEGPQWRHGK